MPQFGNDVCFKLMDLGVPSADLVDIQRVEDK